MLFLIVSLSIISYKRNSIWQSETSIWEDVILKSSHKSWGYNNLGVSYNSLGRDSDAVRMFITSLNIEPDSPYMLNNLGSYYLKAGNLDKAFENYNKALILNPNIALTNYNLGVVYEMKKLNQNAIASYKNVIRLIHNFEEKRDKIYADAHSNLGNIYFELGNIEDAVLNYKEALIIQPGDAEKHNNLGVAYAAKGKTAEAAMEFENALRLQPGFDKALENLRLINK